VWSIRRRDGRLAGSAIREAFRECRTVVWVGRRSPLRCGTPGQHLADAPLRWWPDLDGFAHQSWPLAERVDVLVDLVLRDDFTVDGDIGTG
jgi:hypothetical protein